MNLADCARQDEQAYLDGAWAGTSTFDLSGALYTLAAESETPMEAYSDPERLQERLREMNVSDDDIWRICLMAGVPGLDQLFQADGGAGQRDLDRYVQNAVQKTGLSRMTVLELTGLIAVSAGVAFNYSSTYRTARPAVQEQAFIIPLSVYERELSDFRQRFEQAVASGCLPSLDCTGLDALVATGLPKAKFYKAYYLLHTARQEGWAGDTDTAIALLREAAEAGDADAAAELGDFCYQRGSAHWSEALAYYTGFGAHALNEPRRRAAARILRQKRANPWILLLSAALLPAALAAMAFLPGGATGFSRSLLSVVGAGFSLLILIWGIWRNRRNPCGSLRLVPACILGIWAVCIAILLL